MIRYDIDMTIRVNGNKREHIMGLNSRRTLEKKKKNTTKQNMSSIVCAFSMYSHLCMEMSSFLFVGAWAMPHIQGVPENLSHFVLGLLCFIYSLYGPTTPFI